MISRAPQELMGQKMVKTTRVKDYDQFIVRMPEGLRERIKTKAEVAGVSMNEAIVSVLEREFPEPVTLETRVTRLLGSLLFLKGQGADFVVDDLLKGVTETLTEIADGAVDADAAKREQIRSALEKWDSEDKAREESDAEVAKKLKRPPGPNDPF